MQKMHEKMSVFTLFKEFVGFAYVVEFISIKLFIIFSYVFSILESIIMSLLSLLTLVICILYFS
jgi:hypothetical protein